MGHAVPQKRLRLLAAHITTTTTPRPPHAALAPAPSRCSAASGTGALPPHLTALTAEQLKDFTSRGVVVVPPEHQNGGPGAATCPDATRTGDTRTSGIAHADVWEKMAALEQAGKLPAIGYYDHFPELAELISGRACPGLDAAMSAILGQDWAFQPFIHSKFAKHDEGGEQGWCVDIPAMPTAYAAHSAR
jgi:hypothetical protein